jgi:hypothetical protein
MEGSSRVECHAIKTLMLPDEVVRKESLPHINPVGKSIMPVQSWSQLF